MASTSVPYRQSSIGPERIPHPAHLLILLIASAGALIWGTVLITGEHGRSFQSYMLLLGLFGAASAAFVFSRIHRDRLNIFSVPVFITILVFARFGLVPLYSFAHPEALASNFLGRYDLVVNALLLVVLGMLAFWLGTACLNLIGRGDAEILDSRDHNQAIGLHDPILAMTAGIYGAAFAAKVYLLHARLLNYAMSWKAYHANLASLQVIGVVASLGSCALIVLAIERYSFPSDRKRQIFFLLVFASECAWGLVGGDKQYVLENFFLVALVSSIVQRRIHKGWLLAPFLGLVLLYPLSNAYRFLLRRDNGVASVTSAASLGYEAVADAANNQEGVTGWVQSGWSATMSRMDLLQSVGLVLSLGPAAKFLRGKERWWMIPYYPFIPRFIWRSKPVLNEGTRFSADLGYGDRTSTAITYPGDLYAADGLPGILIGMFLLGVVGQWLSNAVARTRDDRHIFVYAAVFPILIDMEIGAFEFWSTLIKMVVIFTAIAFVIYGPRRPLRPTAARRNLDVR